MITSYGRYLEKLKHYCNDDNLIDLIELCMLSAIKENYEAGKTIDRNLLYKFKQDLLSERVKMMR